MYLSNLLPPDVVQHSPMIALIIPNEKAFDANCLQSTSDHDDTPGQAPLEDELEGVIYEQVQQSRWQWCCR